MSDCDRELNAHFYSAASLKYHAPDTWHDTTPSHIILTLGRPVLALPRKSERQVVHAVQLHVRIESWRWKTIRIFNGCEVWIENSITRITVQHHKTCPCDGIFNSHWTTIIDSFFLHTLPSMVVFKLEYAVFDLFYAGINAFAIKKCSVWLLSMTFRGHLTPPGVR